MESILKASEKAKEHGIDLSKLPQNLDMDVDSITQKVHAMNANCEFLPYDNARVLIVVYQVLMSVCASFSRVLYAVYYARMSKGLRSSSIDRFNIYTTLCERRLLRLRNGCTLHVEILFWVNVELFPRTTIKFLTETGKLCTDIRQGSLSTLSSFWGIDEFYSRVYSPFRLTRCIDPCRFD